MTGHGSQAHLAHGLAGGQAAGRAAEMCSVVEHPSHSSHEASQDSQHRKDTSTSGYNSHTSENCDRHSRHHHFGNPVDSDCCSSAVSGNPFTADEDSVLNPRSVAFDAGAWFQSLNHLSHLGLLPPRRGAGVAFRSLSVHGSDAGCDTQIDVANVWLRLGYLIRTAIGSHRPHRPQILHEFDGLVRKGEMLMVLGPPGSGCSTFLKSLSGETHGYTIDSRSEIDYEGIPPSEMHTWHRGEAIYTAELDVHFPMLSVGDTLQFAAHARAPERTPVSKKLYSQHMRDAALRIFNIAHTIDTRVGNAYVRGISGGERKRVTIAEAVLSGAPLQAWDNSTRGLDAGNAVEFCKTLRLFTELSESAAMVALYQAPQAAYELFDKVVLIYEGREIYFGAAGYATAYFEDMGFLRPPRQTEPDFLTSMTSPVERLVRPGWEGRVPRTAEDFAIRWTQSVQRAHLRTELATYFAQMPYYGRQAQQFLQSRRAQQAKATRAKSAYTLSYTQQVELCLWRAIQRLRGDPSLTCSQLFGNFVMALILGSLFYNLDQSTGSFFERGAAIFIAVLLSAFGSALEVLTLFAQRPIVEKHKRYAFYHPSTEAVASFITDLPYKTLNAIFFSTTLYFLANLRREPGAFFFFLFISFMATLVMSMLFRTIASVCRSVPQSMAPAALIILAIVTFTGFAITKPYMLGWCRWINYLDPIAYAFESLMINEFHGRNFTCSKLEQIPFYGTWEGTHKSCAAIGSRPGQASVKGEAYIETAFGYYHSHKWRNVWILVLYLVGLGISYMVSAEFVSAKKSKGEVLVFCRNAISVRARGAPYDEEVAEGTAIATTTHHDASHEKAEQRTQIRKQTSILSWRNICYDIQVKGGRQQRLLDHVDGWVKPGTLTALMGVSGAGKTTLLDVLARRATIGVVTGEIMVDGRDRDRSFPRKTGYAQQQDLHLHTATVREALQFSAVLRQPATTPHGEKLAYADEVIKLLSMEDYSNAVVGSPGEGLNIEQRKRLTIGIELAAKPELLLFLDEPSSGLDAQSSWSILDLLEKLARAGQAILCTIHQPSALLFQRFDRLLLLQEGGRTAYFGDLGPNAKTVIDYFESRSLQPCPQAANPAEWMLKVISEPPRSKVHSADLNWHQIWQQSREYEQVCRELESLSDRKHFQGEVVDARSPQSEASLNFAATFTTQLAQVTKRLFQQHWRTPSYVYSKTALCLGSSLFIGFIFFRAPLTHQGLQNQMFAVFLLFTIFGQVVQQTMPPFVAHRDLFEAREMPSRTYSWQVFCISNLLVEIPWDLAMAVVMFFCFYYPIGFYDNAANLDAEHERGALFFLFVLQFLLFGSTFSQMVMAALPDAEIGGNIANLLSTLCLLFCGVIASPTTFPRFWIFMYRLSPFTYLVSGMLSTALANTTVACAANELVKLVPPPGRTCAEYMARYIEGYGGMLVDGGGAGDACRFCTYTSSNVFLDQLSVRYADRWRNFGIMWAFIGFNTVAALGLYWLARVPKASRTLASAEGGVK